MSIEKRPIRVVIRHVASGETREDATFDGYWEEGEFIDFVWSEGNFSCDCNRALFFARAVDEDDPEETPCGDGAYSVTIYDESGAELFTDAARPTPLGDAGT